MTTPFTAKPTLGGGLVTLRPICADDVEWISPILREPDVNILTGSVHSSAGPFGEGCEPDALRPIYGRWAEADDRLVLAIVDNVTGQGVGEAVLNDWDAGNRSCGFRILIGAAGQGRGLGTEATRLTVQHALGPMGLHRLSLEVYDINPRARRAYEKAGFVHEGTGRDALLLDDRWYDVHYMSVIGD